MEREWENEPNRKDWEHAGLKCLILRTRHSGALCGYVGVPEGHPAHRKHYNTLPDFDVHGGLTYSDEGDGALRPAGCWWVGFDTNHDGDYSPASEKYGYPFMSYGTYRNMAYVTRETEKLAEQLAAMTGNQPAEASRPPVYLHDWAECKLDGLKKDFDIDDVTLDGVKILLASYTYEDYSGNAFVLFRRGDKYYEVNGSHCSCYGLENQWTPEEADLAELRHRVTKGTFGADEYQDELLALLDNLQAEGATS